MLRCATAPPTILLSQARQAPSCLLVIPKRRRTTNQRQSKMAAFERPLSEIFPRIIELPSGLKLEACLTPPGPVTELDEGRGAAQLPGKRLAICLHPWARLGGNMNDPYVSPTHQCPCNDSLLKIQPTKGPPGTRAPAHALPQIPRVTLQRARRGPLIWLEVILGATRGPGSARARAIYAQKTWRRRAPGRIYRAFCLPSVHRPTHPKTQGYSNGALTASLHPLLPAHIRTAHVLISYPLGPRGLLTAFHTSTYQRALENLVRQPAARVLICYGDADDFTSADSYEEWVEALGELAVDTGEDGEEEVGRHQSAGKGEDGGGRAEQGGNGLEVVRISQATHFWGGHAGSGLIEAVTQFLT